MIPRKKLIVGLAQFTEEYLNFNNENISKQKLKELIKFLNEKNLFYYDTALIYKNVENKIINTKILKKKIKVITKFILPKKPNMDDEKKIIQNLILSLKNLKLKKFEGVLIHNPWDINSSNIFFLKKLMRKIIKEKISYKIGVSVYTLKEFNDLKKYFLPKIVQIPFNIFNTEFNNTGFKNLIKKNKIEIHARSIFLKGVLLKKKFSLSKIKYKKLYRKLEYINKYSQKKKISKIELLVNFVFSHKFIDKIVVGFMSKKEIAEFLSINIKKHNFNKLKSYVPRKEVDPRLWSI